MRSVDTHWLTCAGWLEAAPDEALSRPRRITPTGYLQIADGKSATTSITSRAMRRQRSTLDPPVWMVVQSTFGRSPREWVLDAWRSSVATAGKTTSPSRMEQSVDVGARRERTKGALATAPGDERWGSAAWHI
jgi:hypothetical protein